MTTNSTYVSLYDQRVQLVVRALRKNSKLGEASLADKQTVSHRGRAFSALRRYLLSRDR